MERAAEADQRPALPARGAGEEGVVPALGGAGLLLEPAREHVVVVQDADAVLQPPPEHGRAGLLAAHGVLDLGRVAEPADAPAQRVKLLGPVPVAHAAEAPQQLRRLLLAQRADPGEDGRRAGRPPPQQPSRRSRRSPSMSRSRTSSATCARLRARAARSRLRSARCSADAAHRREAVLEEAEEHVHVPPLPDRAGQLPQHLDGAGDRPAPALAGEQRQGDSQATPGHPHLVDRLLLARHRAGQLPEDALHPVLEQERRPVVRGRRRRSPVSPAALAYYGRPPGRPGHRASYNDGPFRRHSRDRPLPTGRLAPPAWPALRPVAVLDMGASAIRLVVAELPPGEPPRILEEASRSVLLGKDAFTGGRLGATTIEATLRALEGFRRIMDAYGVVRYRAVATSAVREAVNRDTFLDRVRLRTGIDVEIIDGSEENRLTYLAVREALREHEALTGGDTLLVEVGGGSADLSFLRRGEPVYSGTYALGAIRMRQNLAAWHGSHDQRVRLFRRTVQNIVEDIRREMPLREAKHFLALGGDARFVADQIWATTPAARRAGLPARAFPRVLRADGGARRRAARRALPPAPRRGRDPRARAPRLPRAARSRPRPRRCSVPEATLRAGLLLDMVAGRRGARASRTSPARCWPRPRRSGRSTATTRRTRARGVARRRGSSTSCAASTASGARDRLLLEVAALLHDVGIFVSLRGAPQARAVHPLGVGDLRPEPRRHGGHLQRRPLPPPGRAPAVAPALHGPRLRRPRAWSTSWGRSCAWRTPSTPTTCRRCATCACCARTTGGRSRWTAAGDLTLERLAALARADLLTEVFGRKVAFREAEPVDDPEAQRSVSPSSS